MYKRDLEKVLHSWMDSREILIVYGARQVGKTTLLKVITRQQKQVKILNSENPAVSEILQSKNLVRIKSLFGKSQIIVLEEAQRIIQIGEVLKLIYDGCPEYKLIVAGSYSFGHLNEISGPLTGRNIAFRLLPLSVREIQAETTPEWIYEHLHDLLIFGSYPGIVDIPPEKKIKKLEKLTSDYLFKDLPALENLKNPGTLRNILKILAFETGKLVSMLDLSGKLGLTIPAVEKYIGHLEKTFVIFSLNSFSTDLRNEMRRSRKFYFYDNGIRNAIINNFNQSGNRNDMESLWENFCISERLKINHLKPFPVNMNFWRTYDGAEIGLVEEKYGTLSAYAFKWNPKKNPAMPVSFRTKYKTDQISVVNPENFLRYLI